MLQRILAFVYRLFGRKRVAPIPITNPEVAEVQRTIENKVSPWPHEIREAAEADPLAEDEPPLVVIEPPRYGRLEAYPPHETPAPYEDAPPASAEWRHPEDAAVVELDTGHDPHVLKETLLERLERDRRERAERTTVDQIAEDAPPARPRKPKAPALAKAESKAKRKTKTT